MKNKTLTRKMVALLVSVLMLFTIVPFKAFAAESEFAGGDGTKDNPYLISTKEHLNNVRNHTRAHFKMIADIIFEDEDFEKDGAFYNDGVGWIAIGRYVNGIFLGTFDGNDHSIYNLKILKSYVDEKVHQASQYYDLGLFSRSGGIIKNLSIVDSEYTGSFDGYKYDGLGGIVGYNYEGTVENCNFLGGTIVNNSYQDVGGIVGKSNGPIKGCCNSGYIVLNGSAREYGVGGVCGRSDSTIENCANTGMIYSTTGRIHMGGILGVSDAIHFYYDRDTIIENCFNTGDLICKSGGFNLGGIVGNGTGNPIKIKYCYNLGTTLGDIHKTIALLSQCQMGGISGCAGEVAGDCYVFGDSRFKKSLCPDDLKYYMRVSSGTSSAIVYYTEDNLAVGYTSTGILDAVKISLEQAKKKETYLGFDFKNRWVFDSDKYPYPQLRSNPHIPKNIFKPVIETVRDDYVKLREYPGYEYSKDGVKWQTSTTFGNLDKYSEYRFYQRRAKTEVDEAMEASEYVYVAPRAVRENTEDLSSVVSTNKLSSDNNLKSLSVTNIKIYPAFSASVTEYSANVSNDISRLVISAKASDSKAKVTISNPILAADRITKVTVTVKAENGSKKKYTISVYRNGAKANSNNLLREIKIDGFDINPQFNPDTTEYKLTVPYKTDKIKVSGLTSDEKATVKIVGGEKLAVGKENIVKLICKAENGNEKEYTIRVIRSAKKEDDNNDNTSSDISSPISSSDEEENVSSNSSISPKPQNDKKTAGIWLIVGVVIVAMVVGATVTILVVKRKK